MTSRAQRKPKPASARRGAGVGCPVPGPLPAGQTPAPGEAEQRGQQGDRDQYGDRDGAGGGQAHDGQERDVTTASPASAMTTVTPAKSTAEPAVPTARPGRLLGGQPVEQVLPVPGGDEERVVDADREAEHQRQDRRGAGQLDGAAQREQPGHAGADADQRVEHRHAGGDQRAERDDQDDQRR